MKASRDRMTGPPCKTAWESLARAGAGHHAEVTDRPEKRRASAFPAVRMESRMQHRKEPAMPQYVQERTPSASVATVIAGLLVYAIVIGVKLIGNFA